MLVVSYLPQQLLPRLVDAIRDVGADHAHASTWEEVEDIIRRRPVGVVVVDPYAEQTSRADEVASLLRRFPSTPVIAYTQFIPPALKALTLLAQHGLRETVLFQVDDSRSRLSRLIVQASTHSLVIRMLRELKDGRDRLPPLLADAVDDLFRRPHAYTSGRDLVLTSKIPLTSLYRAITEAALGSPKHLFIAARVLHAARYLRDPGYTIEEVAKKTGYLHSRVLTQHTLAVLNVRPSALRGMSEDELLTTLVRWTTSMGKSPAIATAPAEPAEPDCSFREEPEANAQEVANERQPAVTPETYPHWDLVWGALLGYAKYLESVGSWKGAVRVYQVMIDVLIPSDNDEDLVSAAQAFTQYGYVARFLGHFDVSDEAYRLAHALAEKAGSKLLALRIKIGIANTMKVRGNLGDAEALVEQVVTEASAIGVAKAEAWALHSRGVVRTSKGLYTEALIDLFHAHELTEDTPGRELILGDLAGCAWEAGYRLVACDAYRVLLHTAHEPIVRSVALANLLEYSTYHGTAAEFKHIQEQIATHAREHPLPVDHVIQIALHTAYGIERFGEVDAAIAAYRSVIAEAHNIGSHQVEFKAEERLAALLAGTATQNSPAVQEPPETLRSIVATIAEWSALTPRSA